MRRQQPVEQEQRVGFLLAHLPCRFGVGTGAHLTTEAADDLSEEMAHSAVVFYNEYLHA